MDIEKYLEGNKIMSQTPQFLDIIFLAVIVLLLIGRLRSVLGTGATPEQTERKAEKKPSKIVDISEYRTLEDILEDQDKKQNEQDFSIEPAFKDDSEIMVSLRDIKEKYPTFDLADFMQKAPKAFEYIAQAFAEGNKEDLRPLLTPMLYVNFEKVIDERNEKKQTAEFNLISFKSIKLVKAEMTGYFVDLTVEFETEQTNLVKDAEGNTVVGDATYIETVIDVWTLRKDMKSNSPVWVLTATHTKA